MQKICTFWAKNKTNTSQNQTKLPYIYTSSSFNTKRKTTSSNYYSNSQTQGNCDVDGLVQELYYSKNKNHAINREYKELKIEYNKLLESNRTNQRIIEAILRIDPDEEISEKDLNDKIENSQPNEEEAKSLKDAHTILILQKRLKECKVKIEEKDEELKRLKQNSKVIKLKGYEETLLLQDKDIRRLRDENEKLAKKLEETNKKFEDKKLKCDYYQKQANQTKSKLKETQAMYEDEQKKNQDLQKQKQQ